TFHDPYARVRALSKLPCARDNCIGVGALSRHRRWRGLGAFVCDGIARETVEGRRAVSGSLAGMFPARRRRFGTESSQKFTLFGGAGRRRSLASPERQPTIKANSGSSTAGLLGIMMTSINRGL